MQPPVMSRVYAADSPPYRRARDRAPHLRAHHCHSRPVVKQAFLSAEDQKFWSHRGVDPAAIARAGWFDLMQYGRGRRPIGASTITQQVAKNMLLGNEVSIARKVKELILAVRIDQSMSKEHVLELYLNEIYLGLQSYGVAAAAQAYFNKGLDELTLPEAAFLAALPKAPNNYNPFRFADAAKARRDWVLDRMADDHAISAVEASEAKATPIRPAAFRRPETIAGAEWFGEEVRRQLIEQFGADATTQGGYVIRTSLDPTLQSAADRALRQGLLSYDRARGGWRGAVGHLDGGPGLKLGWSSRLAAMPRPPGMLAEWTLAVVLELANDEAKLGWLDRSADSTPRTSSMLLADAAWARPAQSNGLGPAPRRMSDVLQVGDIVMTELAGAGSAPAQPAAAQTSPAQAAAAQVSGRSPVRTDRLLLRQIPQVQGALVSLDPATGRVLAMSGGWSFEGSQFNRATQAHRQPGSSASSRWSTSPRWRHGISPTQRFLDAPLCALTARAGRTVAPEQL